MYNRIISMRNSVAPAVVNGGPLHYLYRMQLESLDDPINMQILVWQQCTFFASLCDNGAIQELEVM